MVIVVMINCVIDVIEMDYVFNVMMVMSFLMTIVLNAKKTVIAALTHKPAKHVMNFIT